MGITALVGRPIKRREDPRLITGQATYVDDIKLPGMLHMAVLRSQYGHARLKSINTDAARQHPDVVAVYTAQDLKGQVGNVYTSYPLGHIARGMGVRSALAQDKVRFYGEPIAVVIAEDAYTARDAIDLFDVDYEPLPAAIDVENAMQPGAPLLYEAFGTNVAFSMQPPPSEDIDKIFAQTRANGGVVVKARLVNQRLAAVAMETRGVVAEFRKADKKLTMWSSSQIPHLLRDILAAAVGLPQHQVRVIVPEVGGGFGSKLNVYPEEFVVAYAAMKLGHPVKWIEDRSENLAATTHGRGRVDHIEVAATKDGRVTGLKIHGISDLGAYAQIFTPGIMLGLGFPMSCGAYDIPVQLSGDIVFTNKAPTDSYRGAGRPEAIYVVERAMDLVAHELGMDPTEVRKINFIKPEQFPYHASTGAVYDTGNYLPALEKAMALIDYEALRAEQAQKRAAGKLMGIGVSSYVEVCGFGPKGFLPFGVYESARVRVERSGTVMVYTGSSPHGQGEETTFAQLVAEGFSIPIENVMIIHGDTDSTPEGRGTYGSRTTAVGGPAVFNAVQRLKEKMMHIAAHLLETNALDVKLEDGRFLVAGSSQEFVAFADVAAAANLSNTLPRGIEPGLETTVFFEPEANVFAFGTYICAVEIDKETGEATLTRMVAVDDCGRQINPMLVEGQVHGGIAQGVGQALWEGIEYTEDGQLVTATLMDYAMPIAKEFPTFELDHTITLTPVNPLGVKGVGESGAVGVPPAVVAAVADALGVTHVDMPFKAGILWNIIHQK
ncbi:MAG: xanthine dehydrogenase family protein molybdopterin-binding subunit [Ktedonobacteraceae bacterium]